MSDGLKTIVLGKYRVEVKSTHWSGIHENWWAQVIGPEGVYARFGKVIPTYRPAELAREAAERDAIAYVDKLRSAK